MMSAKSRRIGQFISFEGSEGSGKSTQIRLLAERLQRHGLTPVVVREPGGTAIGESIRHLLKHDTNAGRMFPETELLLFAASRAQLVREIIAPALQEGKVVLCDRYLDSTTVYQGVARKLASSRVQAVNEFAVGDLLPDATLVLDIDAEEGMRRATSRGNGTPDRMESESIDFYQRVRQGYLVLAESLPERFLVVSAQQDIHTIADQIWHELSKRFTDWPR
jgi:dTMP kinase